MPTLPLSVLNAFPTFEDRAAYEAATDTQAPIFDPNLPVKKWADPTGSGTYRVFNGDNTKPGFKDLVLPSDVAAKVNLTGTPHYSKYTITPTQAVSVFNIGNYTSTSPIPAANLSLRAEADAVAKIVGGTVVEQSSQFFKFNYPDSEPRRVWTITIPNGNWLYAGQVLADVNKAGVGAPGHYEPGAGWISDHIPDGNDGLSHPVMDVPLRPLADGETLVSVETNLGILGTQATAMVQVGQPDVSAGTATGDLSELTRMIKFIYGALGGQ